VGEKGDLWRRDPWTEGEATARPHGGKKIEQIKKAERTLTYAKSVLKTFRRRGGGEPPPSEKG